VVIRTPECAYPLVGLFWIRPIRFVGSDCNFGIEFSIPGSGIEKFVIPGSWDPVSGLGLQICRHFGIPDEHNYAKDVV